MTLKLLKARLKETSAAFAPSVIGLSTTDEKGSSRLPLDHPVIVAYKHIQDLRDALDNLTPEQVEVIERNF